MGFSKSDSLSVSKSLLSVLSKQISSRTLLSLERPIPGFLVLLFLGEGGAAEDRTRTGRGSATGRGEKREWVVRPKSPPAGSLASRQGREGGEEAVGLNLLGFTSCHLAKGGAVGEDKAGAEGLEVGEGGGMVGLDLLRRRKEGPLPECVKYSVMK